MTAEQMSERIVQLEAEIRHCKDCQRTAIPTLYERVRQVELKQAYYTGALAILQVGCTLALALLKFAK